MALFLALLAGCSKSENPQATQQAESKPTPAAQEEAIQGLDACALLTQDEVAAVQGEPFKSTKPNQKSGGGLVVSQCYFELPTTVNSIVVTVTQKGKGPDARNPQQAWADIFHRDPAAGKRGEEGEKKAGPEKIEGIGDEAFWTGTRVGGALYVLKGNTHVRISLGGAGDRESKIEKSKALVQSILPRL